MKKIIFKKIVFGILGAALAKTGRTQTFAEWFEQNSTRLKYYGQQVAALQAYLGQMQQEFYATSAGLGKIGSLKDDEFSEHSNYYSSLTDVKPVIASMPEVTEIRAMTNTIRARLQTAVGRYYADGVFVGDQLNLIDSIYRAVIRANIKDLGAVISLLADDRLRMSDDDRVRGVLAVHSAVRERYSFVVSFTERLDVMEAQVSAGLGELRSVRMINGIQ